MDRFWRQQTYEIKEQEMDKLVLKRKIDIFDRCSLNAKDYQDFLARAFGLMAQRAPGRLNLSFLLFVFAIVSFLDRP